MRKYWSNTVYQYCGIIHATIGTSAWFEVAKFQQENTKVWLVVDANLKQKAVHLLSASTKGIYIFYIDKV